MNVCDKCKNPINSVEKTVVRGKSFDLCIDCADKIKEWIGKDSVKNPFLKMFGQ